MEVLQSIIDFLGSATAEQVLMAILLLAVAVIGRSVIAINQQDRLQAEEKRIEAQERSDSSRKEQALVDVIGTFAETNRSIQATLSRIDESLAKQTEVLASVLKRTTSDTEALDGFRREHQSAHGATLQHLDALAKSQAEGFSTLQESFERVTEATTNGPLREVKESIFQLGQDINASNEAFMKRIINLSNQINIYAARTVRQTDETEKVIPPMERDGVETITETTPETLEPGEQEAIKNG